MFVSPTNWFGLEDNGKDRGRQLAQGEASAVFNLVTQHATDVGAAGEIRQRLRALLESMRNDGYEPTAVLLPIDWRLSQSLGVEETWSRRPEGGLGRNLAGSFEGVAVIQWWDIPEDWIFAVDMRRFCHAVEGIEEDGSPTPPDVTVEFIDERLADEIISDSEALSDQQAEYERKLRVLTSVRTRVQRPYRVELGDEGAARRVPILRAEVDHS